MANLAWSLRSLDNPTVFDLFPLYGISMRDFSRYTDKHQAQVSAYKNHRNPPEWVLHDAKAMIEDAAETLEKKTFDKPTQAFVDALLNFTDHVINKESAKNAEKTRTKSKGRINGARAEENA
jgi:hypothetical protein